MLHTVDRIGTATENKSPPLERPTIINTNLHSFEPRRLDPLRCRAFLLNERGRVDDWTTFRSAIAAAMHNRWKEQFEARVLVKLWACSA